MSEPLHEGHRRRVPGEVTVAGLRAREVTVGQIVASQVSAASLRAREVTVAGILAGAVKTADLFVRGR